MAAGLEPPEAARGEGERSAKSSGPRNVYVRELDVADAEAIAALEASYAPPALLVGLEYVRQSLDDAINLGANMSFGVFDGEELVGYMLAFGLKPSIFSRLWPREAIYVEDLMIQEGHRRWFLALLGKLTYEARVLYPGKPIEANSLATLLAIWKRYQDEMRRFGFSMRRYAPTGEVIDGVDRYGVQWSYTGKLAINAKTVHVFPTHLYKQNYRWPGGHVTVDVVRTEEEWAALEPVWDELLLRTPGHTVFQTYDYLRLWWRHVRTEQELYIITFCVNGRVVGIAPLEIHHTRQFRQRLRELHFIGGRNEIDRPVFFFPEEPVLCMDLLGRFLKARHFEWDTMQFFEQPDRELIDILYRHIKPFVWRARVFDDNVSTTLDLTGGWDNYLAGKSKKFRSNLKASRRKLEAEGKLAYRCYRGDPSGVTRLDDHLAVERKSWKKGRPIGMGRTPVHERFYREVAALFDRKLQFVLHVLYLDGQPIASTWGIAYDGVYYALYIAHDAAFHRFSPGTYLESLELESSFRQGWHTYDSLGGFNRNKFRWSDDRAQTWHMVAYFGRISLIAVYLIRFVLRPIAKTWIRRFGPTVLEWQARGWIPEWMTRRLAKKLAESSVAIARNRGRSRSPGYARSAPRPGSRRRRGSRGHGSRG